MLTFEFDEKGELLLIHGDPAGLQSLVETIQRLVDRTPDGKFDHDHLMSPDWGGDELSSESMGDGAGLVQPRLTLLLEGLSGPDRSKQLDMNLSSYGGRQFLVASGERGFEGFGKGHVGGVVSCEVSTPLPDAVDQVRMQIPHNGYGLQRIDGFESALCR
jgi:hypothetical protein